MSATPGRGDVFRFAPGALLRVELALTPAMREAIAKASERAAAWLQMLDGAMLHALELSPTGCSLRCETARGHIEVHSQRQRLQVLVVHGETACSFDLDGLLLQTGGSRDAYLSQHLGGAGMPQPLAQ